MRHYVTSLTEYEPERWGPLTNSKSLNKSKGTIWFYDDGSIAFKNSHQFTALNKHTKSQWYRWVNDASVSAKRNAQGKLVPTHRTEKGLWWGGRVAASSWVDAARRILNDRDRYARFPNNDLIGGDEATVRDIPAEDIETLRSMLEEITHPALLDLVPNRAFSNIPAGAFQLVQEPDPAALTRRLFGKTRYRKDLVRAVAENALPVTMVASTFRGLVPTDWIVGFIRDSRNIAASCTDVDLTTLRPVLKRLDKRAYRHLLNDGVDNADLYTIRDIARARGAVRLVDGTRPTSWDEFHNLLWPNRRNAVIGGVYHNYEPPAPVDIKPSQDALRIHEAFQNTKYTHVMPTGTADLNAWSETMGNCIRGYDQRASKHQVILGAVLVDNKMVVNYEVSKDMKCVQLLGRFNRPLDKDTHDDVVSIMKKAGVKFPEYYAGQVVIPTLATGQTYHLNFPLVVDNDPLGW